MTVKKIGVNATFNIPEKVSASLDERKRNFLVYFCNIIHNLATTKAIKLITYKLPELMCVNQYLLHLTPFSMQY